MEIREVPLKVGELQHKLTPARRRFLATVADIAIPATIAQLSRRERLKQRSTETPKIEIPRILTERDKQAILGEIYDTTYYKGENLGLIESFWVHGSGETKSITFRDKMGILVLFSGKRYERMPDAWGSSKIKVQNSRNPSGEEYLSITIDCLVNPFIEEQFPPAVADMNIKHETIISYVHLIGIAKAFSLQGIDLGKPIRPQLSATGFTYQKSEQLFRDLMLGSPAFLEVPAESVAELRDTLLLLPLVDRNQDGTVRLHDARDVRGQPLHYPAVQGKELRDGGHFARSLHTLGRQIERWRDIDRVQGEYDDFRKIPGWQEFEQGTATFFQKAKKG